MSEYHRVTPDLDAIRTTGDSYEIALAEILETRRTADTLAAELPLLDGAAEILQAIRDRTLLDAVALGATQGEIAGHLGVSQQAVGQQIRTARGREQHRANERRRLRRGS
jgi:FixJ family two-component response regulator